MYPCSAPQASRSRFGLPGECARDVGGRPLAPLRRERGMDHLVTRGDGIRRIGVQHDHDRRLGHLHLVVRGHREPGLEIRVSDRDEAPRLQVEGRRRQRRRPDDVLDVLPGHRLRREAAHRAPRSAASATVRAADVLVTTTRCPPPARSGRQAPTPAGDEPPWPRDTAGSPAPRSVPSPPAAGCTAAAAGSRRRPRTPRRVEHLLRRADQARPQAAVGDRVVFERHALFELRAGEPLLVVVVPGRSLASRR